MDLSADKYDDARRCIGEGRADDRRTTAQRICAAVLVATGGGLAGSAGAETTLTIATYSAPLSRDGPGLLLRDIIAGTDEQIAAIVHVISSVSPDVLVLTDFDYDLDGLALAAFAENFAPPYSFTIAPLPNSGMATGLDMDGNGRLGEARDAQGYGRFAGDGGIAILSRFPILTDQVRDFSEMLWRDLPEAELPETDAGPFPSAKVQDSQRLSSSSHLVVPIEVAAGLRLDLLTFAATPPVFDGPEDLNGLRNRDELRFWTHLLNGHWEGVGTHFLLAGLTNLDPHAGEGFRDEMETFLLDARLNDPLAGIATAKWPERGLPPMRVSYVLPSTAWRVVDAGVVWPDPATPLGQILGPDGAAAGPHRLVWTTVAQ